MTQAKAGDTVAVHYTGKLENGVAFDTSIGSEPLRFKIGDSRMIPGFEEAIIGMEPGESKTVKIPTEKAYGRYREDKVIKIDLKDLPDEITPQIGMNLEVFISEDNPVSVQITDIEGTTITLDANHPLVEKDLIFEIKLIEIVQ